MGGVRGGVCNLPYLFAYKLRRCDAKMFLEHTGEMLRIVEAKLLTDGELAEVFRVSPRALRDYRNDGILPYIRMKGNILYRESDIEKVLIKNESKTR